MPYQSLVILARYSSTSEWVVCNTLALFTPGNLGQGHSSQKRPTNTTVISKFSRGEVYSKVNYYSMGWRFNQKDKLPCECIFQNNLYGYYINIWSHDLSRITINLLSNSCTRQAYMNLGLSNTMVHGHIFDAVQNNYKLF